MTDDTTRPIPPRVTFEKIRIQEDEDGLYFLLEQGRDEHGFTYMKLGI
jgi:hypothetical protein